MNEITIREVGQHEVEELQRIGRQTFAETFAQDNTREDMEAYLEKDFAAEKLARELANEDSRFFFALLQDEAIGYLKVNTGAAQTEKQDEKALEIERIYVLKAFHGKKLGQLLYEKALELARQHGAAYVWLGVWEENLRAIGFYRKNGFVEFGKHTFWLGKDEQTDILMKLQLNAK